MYSFYVWSELVLDLQNYLPVSSGPASRLSLYSSLFISVCKKYFWGNVIAKKKKKIHNSVSSDSQSKVIHLAERKCWRRIRISEEEGINNGESQEWSENMWTGWKMAIESGM